MCCNNQHSTLKCRPFGARHVSLLCMSNNKADSTTRRTCMSMVCVSRIYCTARTCSSTVLYVVVVHKLVPGAYVRSWTFFAAIPLALSGATTRVLPSVRIAITTVRVCVFFTSTHHVYPSIASTPGECPCRFSILL